MERLTLNMLLSFAQFEREVTAERIRDKIAASKAKGMWMGGQVPYGYAQEGRTLKIREDEAVNLRWIFEQAALGVPILDLAAICDARGVKTRTREKDDGTVSGGLSFSRGHLNQMLNNPIYRGKIRHKGKEYDGLREAIISKDLWDKVQDVISERCNGARKITDYRES